MTDPARRKVSVPGDPVDVTTVLIDAARNAVLSITLPGNSHVLVVFTSIVGKPTARIMTVDEAKEFGVAVVAAHTALADDAKIAEMEKEFQGDD